MTHVQSTAIEPAATGPAATFNDLLHNWRHWWERVIADVDQAAVIEARREEGAISGRYLFLTAMSAGIAVLGLLLSSPAVVIGAMLLSPLMGPIIGLGFALAIGDYRWLRESSLSLIAGCVLAIGLCAAIVAMSPIQTVTSEIAARTRPNLFDLLVALFSALAGAYAMVRGREGTIVGVAIATALMPPLAVVGFGLATDNWTVFTGAALLFVTNAITIALTAMVMARLYGFRARLTDRQSVMQNLGVLAVFGILAVPLGFSLVQIARETNGERAVRSELSSNFNDSARVSQIDIDWRAEPVTVDATVLTPAIEPDAEAAAERNLTRALGRPIDLRLNQYQVGTSSVAAEAAQLAAAEARKRQAESQQVTEIVAELAVVAGVAPEEGTVDRQNRRAVVRAKALPGADLATYRALEKRVVALSKDWAVELIPPAGRPLGLTVPFADGEPTSAGRNALAVGGWAAARTGGAIELRGGDRKTRARAAEILGEAGVTPQLVVGGPEMELRWVDPAR